MIGIGITTLNRRQQFDLTLKNIQLYSPRNTKIVVVDDGSAEPLPRLGGIEIIHNRRTRGVARAKNQCLAALMSDPKINDIFLFDDDCWPTEADWWKPYVESPEQHLSHAARFEDRCCACNTKKFLVYNTVPGQPFCVDCRPEQLLRNDADLFAVQWGSGVMMYFTRDAVEKVGGFRKEFGRYGCEHWDIAYRCRNAGLSQYPFQDVSHAALWSVDAHSHGYRSCVPQKERVTLLERNWKVFQQFKDASDFVPYIEKSVDLKATVCIPWRETPDRIAAYDRCLKFWNDNGFTVSSADSDKNVPFTCGKARNNAVRQAATDIIIIADGDTLPGDIRQIREAMEWVNDEPDMFVWPFTVYRYIPNEAVDLDDITTARNEGEYPNESPGGIVVCNRQTFWDIGGFDERFPQGGWGFDDRSFQLAAKTLAKAGRLPGMVYSFDHKANRDLSNNNPNKVRYRLYEFAARAGADVMRELIK